MLKAIFGGLLLLSYAVHASATTLLYKSFNDLIKESDGIVAGTVASIESQYDRNKEIYTFVTLDQLDVLSGSYQGTSLTLRLKGGQVGHDISHIDGSPEFKQNDRVVLFVQGNGRDLVPLVGWTQGAFRIVEDPITHQQVVHDHEGNRVLGVQAGQVLKEQVMNPEAQVVGEHAAVATAAERDGGAGSNENQARNSQPRNEHLSSAKPTMSSQAFIAAIRRLSVSKQSRAQLISVSPMDFSNESNKHDAAPAFVHKRSGTVNQAPQSTRPVSPKRMEAPPVSDKQ